MWTVFKVRPHPVSLFSASYVLKILSPQPLSCNWATSALFWIRHPVLSISLNSFLITLFKEKYVCINATKQIFFHYCKIPVESKERNDRHYSLIPTFPLNCLVLALFSANLSPFCVCQEQTGNELKHTVSWRLDWKNKSLQEKEKYTGSSFSQSVSLMEVIRLMFLTRWSLLGRTVLLLYTHQM